MADETEPPQLSTQIALLRQELSHMGGDVSDMKQDFKEFKQFYATKEELAYFKSEWKTSHNALSNQMKNWKNFVVGVGVIVAAAVILALLKLGLPNL